MERPTNSEPFGTTTRRIEPVREEQYADLVAEYLHADDVHDSYRLRHLIIWHVPTPWRGWRSFAIGRTDLLVTE